MRRSLAILLTLLALAAAPAAERSDAYTIIPTPLTANPFSDATPVAALPVHTDLTVLARKGGWYQVSLPSGQNGWLRMTALEFNRSPPATRSSALAGVLSLFESGRSGAGGGTAATGLRGLNTGDIAAAKPDTDAVDGLKAWAATPDIARQYSAALPLRPYSVEYVDADGKPSKP